MPVFYKNTLATYPIAGGENFLSHNHYSVSHHLWVMSRPTPMREASHDKSKFWHESAIFREGMRTHHNPAQFREQLHKLPSLSKAVQKTPNLHRQGGLRFWTCGRGGKLLWCLIPTVGGHGSVASLRRFSGSRRNLGRHWCWFNEDSKRDVQ